VDLTHCERAAEAAVAAGRGQLLAAAGELFDVSYFDNLAREVDEELRDGGKAVLGALRFALRCIALCCAVFGRAGGAALPSPRLGMGGEWVGGLCRAALFCGATLSAEPSVSKELSICACGCLPRWPHPAQCTAAALMPRRRAGSAPRAGDRDAFL
jgi:hypothetical protein